MISQLGESITIGGVAGMGIMRLPDEETMLAGDLAPLIGRIIELTVKTGAFPVVIPGTVVTRGAETYKIHTPLQQHDGAITKLLCERVA